MAKPLTGWTHYARILVTNKARKDDGRYHRGWGLTAAEALSDALRAAIACVELMPGATAQQRAVAFSIEGGAWPISEGPDREDQ